MAMINMNRSLETGEGGMREGRRDGELGGKCISHSIQTIKMRREKKKSLEKQAFFVKLVIFFFQCCEQNSRPQKC